MAANLSNAVKNANSGGNPIAIKSESLGKDALRRMMRNRAAVIGAIIIVLLYLMMIFADKLAPFDYATQTLAEQNAVPPWLTKIFPTMAGYAKPPADDPNKYILGADYVGRDLLSRIIHGSRVSLIIAIIGPMVSLLIGVIYGCISGYVGGRTDNIMMRIVDVLYAFPSLLFTILLMTFFRSATAKAAPGSFVSFVSAVDNSLGGMMFIFIGIGLTAWQTKARLTRGQVLSTKEKEYVEAARSIGATDSRILFNHILPNIIGPLVVSETLSIPGYINTEAFLSFIGLGVNPPTPSWGAMISDGAKVVRTYPNQTIFPALTLAITMFAFNFLGDGLRDALDPQMRGRS